MQEVKEGLKLDNLRTDHVMIRSELKYLIAATIVDFKCRVVGGKTAPFPTVRVFHVVKPIATVRFRVEPNPELTREFGPIANTEHNVPGIHETFITQLTIQVRIYFIISMRIVILL
jgi:hypothetical protein